MKEKLKKIILILVIIISLAMIPITIYYANNHTELTNEFMKMHNELNTKYIIIITLSSIVFSLSLLYLTSKKGFYKNKDKLIVYILSNIVLTGFMTISSTYIANNYVLNNTKIENTEKDKVTLDKSNVITDTSINLNDYDTDITITNEGTYTLSGKLNHSVIVDSDGEVELILNNVEITTEKTATIIGLNGTKLIITLKENTTNSLTDNGNSEYDGCIFSNIPLEFNGEGKLTVNGNQNEGEGIATEAQPIVFNGGTYIITSNDDGINAGGDGNTITINDGVFYIDASGDGIDSNKNLVINGGTIFVMGSDIGGDSGIDTDEGYIINGGTVIAIGTDMIELPNENSQNTLAFTLNETIEKNTIISLMKDDEEIISFKPTKSFKTLIISSDELNEFTYSLYKNSETTGSLENGIYTKGEITKGELIKVSNTDEFTLTSNVTYYK